MPIESALLEPMTTGDAWRNLRAFIDSEDDPSRDELERIKSALGLNNADLHAIVRDVRQARELHNQIDEHNGTPSQHAKALGDAQQAVGEHEATLAAFKEQWTNKANELQHAVRQARTLLDAEEREQDSARAALRELREKYPQLLTDALTASEQAEQAAMVKRGVELDRLAWRVVRGVDETFDSGGEMQARLDAATRRLERMTNNGARITREGRFPRTTYHITLGDERYLLSWAIARRIESDWQQIQHEHQVTKDSQGEMDLHALRAIEMSEASA